jgi:hypothetical protein
MRYFDANNQEHQALANAHNTGNYNQWSPDQMLQHYQNVVQNGPEDQVQQAQQEYFSQLPKAQQMSLFSGLMDAVRGQQGGNFDPRQAGVSTTNPQQASPFDLGNLFNFAMNSGLLGGGAGGLGGLLAGGQSQSGLGGLFGGQQQPNYQQQPGYGYGQQGGYGQQQQGGLQGLLSNPLAQAAISGLVGYMANKAMNNFANRGQQQQPNYNQYNQPNQNFGQGQMQSYNDNNGGGSALPGFENNNREM